MVKTPPKGRKTRSIFSIIDDDDDDDVVDDVDTTLNKNKGGGKNSFFFQSLLGTKKTTNDNDDDDGMVVSTTRPITSFVDEDEEGSGQRRRWATKRRNQRKQQQTPAKETTEIVPAASSTFDAAQRIQSIKAGIIGALAGGIAMTPIAFLHYVVFAADAGSNGVAQWEFTTDMSSIEAGLFAIVYRYIVRQVDNNNPMLQQGAVGAFIVTRTLSNIEVSSTCSSVPLQCGEPLGYFDWNMISQLVWNGVESTALFGVAAIAMEVAYKKQWIQKF